MSLRDKVSELLHAQNDEEIGTFHGPIWAAVVETDVLQLANEVGVEFTLDELDEVHGAQAAVVHRVGQETQVHLFASTDEAGAHWDEVACQVR